MFQELELYEGEPAWERMGKLARICIDGIEQSFGETVELHQDSLAKIDRILSNDWSRLSDAESLDSAILTFGAFVGEILVRSSPGRWVSELSDDFPASVLYLDSSDEPLTNVSPFLLVKEKIENRGSFDLVAAWSLLEQKLSELRAA